MQPMCSGINEQVLIPNLLSSLSSTELCLMILIERKNVDIVYRSRFCSGDSLVWGDIGYCNECKALYDNLVHFHHLYLKQSCSQFSQLRSGVTVPVAEVTPQNRKKRKYIKQEMKRANEYNELKEEQIDNIKIGKDLGTEVISNIILENSQDQFMLNYTEDIETSNKKFEGTNNVIAQEKTKSTHKCGKCGEHFVDKKSIREHMIQKHKEKCPFCTLQFSTVHQVRVYQNHLALYHCKENQSLLFRRIMELENILQCMDCDYISQNSLDLRAHMKIH